ncbi:Fe-S cluster assembly protein SufD [Schnuerera sp.]|uniref:Fe-S cluster assembly protein SufD n=1 Tax=Schnuerera sp. TaxID=2794844 RepID=UPI002CA012D0|nr:Fe-S cluster assembly protein SufD [Schnuerera sp.]HSH36096.1 Fe-S cluster assembly protein SufD [Schnuerera sp.]
MKIIDKENFIFPNISDYKKDYLKLETTLPEGVVLEKITKKNNEIILDYLYTKEFKGVGEKFTTLAEESYNSGIIFYIPRNIKIDKPIKIEFNMDEENPVAINQNIIVVEEGSEGTIIMDYTTSEKVKAFHNGLTKIYAKENSIINIIKIQRMNDISHNFDSNIAFVKGQGQVNWISIELGSGISSSNYSNFLEDEASEANLYSIYLGDGNREIDLEYSMIHKGPRSISNIETKGVLMDHSKKEFKGNLDFKKGARLSKGIEEEYVILLDPTVKSNSIPALLCHEDDVEGEHAASAGQINENKLFYLMSRGLEEREAKKLIVEASFRPIIDKIPFEDYRKIVIDEVERRLMNGKN